MAWKPPKYMEEMFGAPKRTYKTTGSTYTKGDLRKMQWYEDALRSTANHYAKERGVDSRFMENALKGYMRDRELDNSVNNQQIRKNKEGLEKARRSAAKKEWNSISKEIEKGRDKDTGKFFDPEAEKLNKQVKDFIAKTGRSVNDAAVTRYDLKQFQKIQELNKGKNAAEKAKEKKEKKKKKDDGRDGILGFLDSTLGRASKSAQELVLGKEFVKNQAEAYSKSDNEQVKKMQKAINKKAETKLEKAGDIFGKGVGIGSYIVPGSGAANLTSKAFTASKALRPGAQLAEKFGIGATDTAKQILGKKILQKSAEGAGAGAIVGTGDALLKEAASPSDRDLKQHLQTVALETAGGAVLDPLIGIGGPALLKKGKKLTGDILERLKGKKPTEQAEIMQEILGLPAPKEVSRLKYNEPVGKNVQEILGLPAPKTQRVIPAKRVSDQYAVKLSRLFEEANKSNMPPGREREFVEDLWSRMAGPDDPSLDRLIELATPSLKRMNMNPADMVSGARESFNNPYGFDPYSRFKASDEVIPSPNEGTPLAFKRERFNPVINENVSYVGQNNNPVSQQILGDLNINPRRDSVKVTSKPNPKIKEVAKTVGEETVDNAIKNQFEPKKKVNLAKQEIASALEKEYENISPQREPDLIRVDNTPNAKDIQDIKDINQFQVGTQNIYQLADRLPPEQGNRIKSVLDEAKVNHVNQQEQLTNDLFDKVVNGLGIKKGSKDSALVQDFGEKTLVKKFLKKQGIDPAKLSPEEIDQINLQQLKKVHPDKWEKIVAANNYFREQYDRLIDEVNAVRAELYPNNPEKIVPKRSDYYHHFNELTGFEGVKNLFDTPANIDPHLEGVSPFTKPKTKFQGFMQKRMNGAYKSDAVGGFLKYLQAASHSINVDPVIPVLRQTANELADATTETRNANKIIEALQDHANDLAGKTNPYDRLLQKITGRKGVRLISAANSRVKGNMIVGNLASALGQIGNVPLGIGKAKQYAVPGLVDTLTQTANQVLGKTKLAKPNMSAPIHKSQFLKERYADQMYRRFDQKLLEQPKKLAIWMMETVDKSGTNFIWNSMYKKGLAERVADPIKYADELTRHIVAGRGVGEVPLIQKAKTTQIFAPFTLEVGNQWNVLKKMVGEKDAVGLMTFLVASYGLNEGMEYARGNGVSLDPVGAVVEGYQKGEGGAGSKSLNAGASLLGEVVGNIPGGNLLTRQVNTDKKVPFTDIQFKELFGERDPNRFGSGLTVSKMIEDPLYAVLPFGASQVRKTSKGLETLLNEGVYKGDNSFIPFTGDKEELMYPVNASAPLNKLKTLLLGPSASSEGKDYYDNNRRSLGANQTAEYETARKSGEGMAFYNNILAKRLQGNMDDVRRDKELSSKEKERKLNDLLKLLQEVKGK